jgi:hypothetical protein
MGGEYFTLGEIRNVHTILVGKPEGERPVGRFEHHLKYCFEIDHQERGCEDVDWIYLP